MADAKLAQLNQQMPEKRLADRRRMLKGVRIVCGGDSAPVNAVLRDLSQTGAKLDVATEVEVPDRFVLVLPDGATQPSEVVWRDGDRIGVSFIKLDQPELAAMGLISPKALILNEIAELEMRVIALREMVEAQIDE